MMLDPKTMGLELAKMEGRHEKEEVNTYMLN
jgi:hypothetical protein